MATVIDTPTSAEPGGQVRGFPRDWTLADLQKHLGGIPLERIRLNPPPGLATEQDLFDLEDRGIKCVELIDGVLVEKAMGWQESLLAGLIIHEIHTYLERHDLGHVLAPDGIVRILPTRFRAADVAFFGWRRFPKDKKLPRRPVPKLIPDLAIEVLSDTNTKREIELKLKDYFKAGVVRVWVIDPPTRSARVYTSARSFEEVEPEGTLDGGELLPGFRLWLKALFERAFRDAPDAAE